ncbi:tyrosine-type recombinase/integrase [Desulfofustis glycolicus]|uniref:Integrase n=1 Tax=Desulfofustis glycolicus DSM 9705 TaxID=1121409 RepID=A0A1M5YD13_9BACT|nr:site-specific integrase [Desulfofustis glycolicus]SHI09961.1 integrase [Desulfofustis glycolicus DSM 9705]
MAVTIRRKRKNGPWFVFVTHQGKRKSYSAGSKEAAIKLQKVLQGELALGKAGFMNTKTIAAPIFRDVRTKWLTTVVPSKCKPATLRLYQSLDRTYLESIPWRDKAVDQITTGEVKEYLFDLLKERSASTCSHVRDAISGIFELCKDHKYIEVNPARGIRLRKPPNPVPEPYNQREIERFLRTAEGTKFYALWALLVFTGCRLSEAFAAKHTDFDLERRVWHLQRSLSAGQISTPKSGKARTVDLSNRLVDILAAVQKQESCDWMFPNEKGNLLQKSNVYHRHWKQLLKAAKLRHTRIHDLRHSWASRMIAAGANLYYCQRQLGHSSIQILIDRYTHLLPDHRNDSKPVDLIDNTLETPQLSVIRSESQRPRALVG